MNNLNWDRDFALEQAAEDAELLQELIDIFKESYKNDLLLLQAGLQEKNTGKVRGAAHSIKGAAASLGIQGIRDLALSIETDARAGSLSVARQKFAQLEALHRELMQL